MDEELLGTLRTLITIGLVLLLVMLRFDAERFGAAEYDEASRDGRAPSLRRRIAWYLLGVALVVAILFVHPAPQAQLFMGAGERVAALLGGLVFGVIGATQAVVFARVRYHHFRLPDVRADPGALVNAIATAFIDEATSRGVLIGLLRTAGLHSSAANIVQALIYVLS